MIVLDTNVVSELMKAAPAPAVTSWIAEQAVESLYTTSITQAEILHGIMLLPPGKRRRALASAAVELFEVEFGGRVLAFGSDAAPVYAEIAVERKKVGRPISHFDAQIAAIAQSAGAALATRNVPDFEGCGVRLINPWKSDAPTR